jgi:CBS domain-containing protein
MAKISHILLPNPVVIPTGTQLNEAAKLMKTNKITSVLVSKNGRLAGIMIL